MPDDNRYSQHEPIPAEGVEELLLKVRAKWINGHQVFQVYVPQQEMLYISIAMIVGSGFSQRMSQLHCCLVQRLAHTSMAATLPSRASVLRANRLVENLSHDQDLTQVDHDCS
jgi:hypothetical protein